MPSDKNQTPIETEVRRDERDDAANNPAAWQLLYAAGHAPPSGKVSEGITMLTAKLELAERDSRRLFENLVVALAKWDTLANDDRYNGHMRQVYIVCAKDLREAIGTKPDPDRVGDPAMIRDMRLKSVAEATGLRAGPCLELAKELYREGQTNLPDGPKDDAAMQPEGGK